MVLEDNNQLLEHIDSIKEHDELQCLNFPCSIPDVTGRGFLEVCFCYLCDSLCPGIGVYTSLSRNIRLAASSW